MTANYFQPRGDPAMLNTVPLMPPAEHGPSAHDATAIPHAEPAQRPTDLLEEMQMESFPCSDPPASTTCHI